MLAPGDHQCVEYFLRWLAKTSPCTFARRFAARPATKKPRMLCAVVLESLDVNDIEDIERMFDEAALRGDFAAVLFPRLRYASEVKRMLSTLLLSRRWRCSRADWGRVVRPDDVPVALHFRTRQRSWSSAMGMAPLGSMPVTRRSPYVAIVVWTGGRENKLRKVRKNEKGVGFIDAPTRLAATAYQKAMADTFREVRVVLGDPVEDTEALREVGFFLPQTLGEELIDTTSRRTHA